MHKKLNTTVTFGVLNISSGHRNGVATF